MSGVSPLYEVPWPVLLAAGAAVVLLCLASYLLGQEERDTKREQGRQG